jgi:hypothetical protein
VKKIFFSNANISSNSPTQYATTQKSWGKELSLFQLQLFPQTVLHNNVAKYLNLVEKGAFLVSNANISSNRPTKHKKTWWKRGFLV